VAKLPGDVETYIASKTEFYRAEEYHQKFYAK
jgi:peptide methionine sulfoxide reductase MsrA